MFVKFVLLNLQWDHLTTDHKTKCEVWQQRKVHTVKTISPSSTCPDESRPQTLFMADSAIVHAYSKKKKCHNSIKGRCDITPAGTSTRAAVTSAPDELPSLPQTRLGSEYETRDFYTLVVSKDPCTCTRVFPKAFSPCFSFHMHIQSRVYDLLPVYNNARSQYMWAILGCTKKW